MSKRFIVDSKNIKKVDNNISIFGDEAHHINVLRYRVKDKVYINEYEVEITEMDKEYVSGVIVGSLEEKGVPNTNITLVQAYLKSDKMEHVTQKAVELGAKEILPVMSKNCVVKLDEKDKTKKVDRLNKIAKEAVEQCGRTDEVEVLDVENLLKVDYSKFDAVLICHEASTNSLKEAINNIKNFNSIAVIVGPEGGLDEKEVEELLRNKNAYVVSLGERVLRAETASFSILSILWYELG
ncbi:MAG: 16S rRNA (uracil(1498)-N(3))-methyltransferase [Clostridia bacterium]|nr:16S rRNA (uracil(1498)-N(3))-methyltransferase [Clostridia bacterium]